MASAPAPASALDPVGSICGLTGLLSGVAGKACKVLQGGEKLLGAGKQAVGGGGNVARAVGLAAVGAWVLVGAKVALNETAKILDHTTSPQLASTWFSSAYWRMAAIAGVLTLPFLFAAAIQALMRSDLALLARAALVYLPLALLTVSIAAPLTMLLLAASDQMSAIMASAAGHAGTRFLAHAGMLIGGLAVIAGAPFIAFVVGLLTVAAAVVLWLELLMREAAVYVVVLMLPLAFAALVWPARRVWALRAAELLAALILSKFAIVAVLALGGAALGQSPFSGVSGMLAGTVLVTMGAFAPWAVVRLLPLAELASGAAGALRGEGSRIRRAAESAEELAGGASNRLRRWSGQDDGGFDADLEGAPARAARAQTERLAELAPLPTPADRGGDGVGDGGSPPGGAGGPLSSGGGGAGSGGPLSSDGGGRGSGGPPPFGGAGDPGAVPGASGGPGSHDPLSGDSAGEFPRRRAPIGAPFRKGDVLPLLYLGRPQDWPAAPAADEPSAGGTDADSTADDPDPRPPAPEPEDGRL